ncbi:MAG: F420-dependent NADP oxidoreductase [Clostridia bacterium]|nr:F420-dependent NADP oxidoreductase [Clostridia bacterium]
MRFGVIGAGKLGCALAIGLHRKGYEISGVCSRNEESVTFLGNILGKRFNNNLGDTVKSSDVVFITVPDTQLESVAGNIGSLVDGESLQGKVFLHCSGALTSDVLTSISSRAYIGSLHPIQTFADREKGWTGLDGISFGFEGCVEAEGCAFSIVKIFNGNMITIRKEDKPVYHAAACMLSNYTVALCYMAEKLFDSIGIEPAAGINAFLPLVEKTVDNIKALGSEGALTGPISRGDGNVVGEHIKSLNLKCPQVLEVYKIMGTTTVELALKKGSITCENAEILKKLLK